MSWFRFNRKSYAADEENQMVSSPLSTNSDLYWSRQDYLISQSEDLIQEAQEQLRLTYVADETSPVSKDGNGIHVDQSQEDLSFVEQGSLPTMSWLDAVPYFPTEEHPCPVEVSHWSPTTAGEEEDDTDLWGIPPTRQITEAQQMPLRDNSYPISPSVYSQDDFGLNNFTPEYESLGETASQHVQEAAGLSEEDTLYMEQEFEDIARRIQNLEQYHQNRISRVNQRTIPTCSMVSSSRSKQPTPMCHSSTSKRLYEYTRGDALEAWSS